MNEQLEKELREEVRQEMEREKLKEQIRKEMEQEQQQKEIEEKKEKTKQAIDNVANEVKETSKKIKAGFTWKKVICVGLALVLAVGGWFVNKEIRYYRINKVIENNEFDYLLGYNQQLDNIVQNSNKQKQVKKYLIENVLNLKEIVENKEYLTSLLDKNGNNISSYEEYEENLDFYLEFFFLSNYVGRAEDFSVFHTVFFDENTIKERIYNGKDSSNYEKEKYYKEALDWSILNLFNKKKYLITKFYKIANKEEFLVFCSGMNLFDYNVNEYKRIMPPITSSYDTAVKIWELINQNIEEREYVVIPKADKYIEYDRYGNPIMLIKNFDKKPN